MELFSASNLYHDLWLYMIFPHLDCQNLCRVAQVCKRFQNISSKEFLWQPKFLAQSYTLEHYWLLELKSNHESFKDCFLRFRRLGVFGRFSLAIGASELFSAAIVDYETQERFLMRCFVVLKFIRQRVDAVPGVSGMPYRSLEATYEVAQCCTMKSPFPLALWKAIEFQLRDIVKENLACGINVHQVAESFNRSGMSNLGAFFFVFFLFSFFFCLFVCLTNN